jgi:hypothetical protein
MMMMMMMMIDYAWPMIQMPVLLCASSLNYKKNLPTYASIKNP